MTEISFYTQLLLKINQAKYKTTSQQHLEGLRLLN